MQTLPPCTATAACSLPTTFKDEVLSVSAATDCTSTYTLYAKTGGSADVLAFGVNQAITVEVRGLDQVTITQQCNGQTSSMLVQVAPLRTAYNDAMNSNPVAPITNVETSSCTMEGVTHSWNELWTASNGQSCQCLQGVASCYPNNSEPLLSGAESVAVAFSVILIILVLLAFAFYFYSQKKKREVIEGRRKSFGQKMYCGHTGDSAPKGQQEMEMPAYQQEVGVVENLS